MVGVMVWLWPCWTYIHLFLSGKYTLRDFVRAVRRETASWKDRLMTLMQELAGILERLHGLGYAHNDLKPDNIMMFGTTTSTPKLIDWENATQIGEPFPYSGDRFRCSVEYAAPEVLKGTAGAWACVGQVQRTVGVRLTARCVVPACRTPDNQSASRHVCVRPYCCRNLQ